MLFQMVESWQQCVGISTNYAPLMMLLEEEAANEDPTAIGLHSQLSRHRLAVSSPKRRTPTVLRQSSALAASQIRAQISSTTDDISSASTIVNAALRDHLPTSAPTEALPETSSLVRMTNRYRQGDPPTPYP